MYEYSNSDIQQQFNIKKLRKLQKQQQLNSVRMFNFNNQWGYDVQSHIPTQRQNNFTQMKQKRKLNVNNLQEELNRKKKEANKKYSILKKDLNNEAQLIINSQIFTKKKAFSHFESQNIIKSHLQNNLGERQIEPSIWLQQDEKKTQSQDSLQKDLIVNSKRLMGMKLPQINSIPRKNNIVVKMKLQNLKVVNIEQRVKTMKYTPEKTEIQSSFSSQMRFNNKIQIQKVINDSKFDIYKPPKLHINEKNLIQQKIIQNNKSQRLKKSFFKIQKINQQNQNKKIKKIQEQSKQQNIQPSFIINEQSATESFFPKIQVYDKKMKIGKRIKKEEDKIKAMLMKTLQKTKAVQYVAQCGSSQRNNSKDNSVTSHKRSLSKNSKQEINQQPNIVLIQEQSINKNCGNMAIKRLQMQRLKKSLRPQQKQYSSQVKNKKMVQMVRQVQDNKNKDNKKRRLQQIKQQQKTLINEQSDNNSQNENNKTKCKQINIHNNQQYLRLNQINKQDQNTNNQFLQNEVNK